MQPKEVKNKIRGAMKISSPNSTSPLVEIISTNKKSIKISVEFLENIWKQKTDKSSLFLIVFKKNSKEVFLLNCCLEVQKRELK